MAAKTWNTDIAQMLYDAGKTDGEIAVATGVTRQTIARWRKCSHLPPNREQGSTLHGGRAKTPFCEEDIFELHDVGASDKLISHHTGVPRQRIAGVRDAAGMESNYTKTLPEELLWGAYEAGWHDAEIARQADISAPAVASWRDRNNLPPNKCVSREPLGPGRAWDREEAERLYKLGLPDTRIAAQVGVSTTTIRKWRKEHGLPVQVRRSVSEADIEALYKEGLNDTEIASKLGISDTQVGNWRRNHDLPRNHIVLDVQAARMLWEQEKNDAEIARTLGTTRAIVRKWRTRSGLPPNSPTRLDEQTVRELYDTGKNDCEIAREIGVSSGAIWQWRKRNGLEARK